MSALADFVGGSFQRAVVQTLDRVIIDVLVLALAFIIPKQPEETAHFIMYALFMSMLLLVVRDFLEIWKNGQLYEKFFGKKPDVKQAQEGQKLDAGGDPGANEIKQPEGIIGRLEAARRRALGTR